MRTGLGLLLRYLRIERKITVDSSLYDSHELVSWVREFGNQIVPTQNPYFQACWPPEASSKLENRGKAYGWVISGYRTLLPARQAGRRGISAHLWGIKRLRTCGRKITGWKPMPLIFRTMLCFACTVVFCFFYTIASARGQATLATAIDSLVERDFEPLMGANESDGLLLRRLSLDLRMLVPTQHELDEFLADKAADRWSRWVQRFLSDPLYDERMVDWLDKTLLQRRPFQHVDRAKWLVYLRKVVDDRTPLDQISKETIGSVWWNQSQRAQQRFFLERAGDSHAVARDIGRVFFGRDMQCAQCHDHPLVDDYLQIDYHGLLAFVSSSSFVETKFKDEKGAEQKLQIYAERAARDAPFESVFDKGILFRTGRRAPGGSESFDPFEAPDMRYQTKPMPESMEGAPNPPLFSRRSSLVAQLSATNRAFAENWSNRLWALMMGKGLVHPLDMHHPDNPPTNPKLLDALTDALIDSGFNMRTVMEQIALSRAYRVGARMLIEESLRLGSVINLPLELQVNFESDLSSRKKALEAPLLQLASSADVAKNRYADAESSWRSVQKERVEVWSELDKSEGAFKEVMKKADAANQAFEKAQKLLSDAASRQKLLEEASEKLEQAKLLGPADDAELMQAIATTKSKADGSKATIPNLEKALADATTARDTHKLSLEADRSRLHEIAAKLQTVEQRLHIADDVFVAARSNWQKAQSEHVVVENRMNDLSRIQSWLTASQSVRSLEQEHSLAIQSSEQCKTTLATQVAQTTLLQQQIADTTLAKSAVTLKHDQAMEEKKNTLSQLELLRTTYVSLDKAIALVKSTESLFAAKQVINDAIESTQQAYANTETRIDSIADELVAQAKVLESQTSQLANDQQTCLVLRQRAEQSAKSVTSKAEWVGQSIQVCAIAMQSVQEERQKSGHLAQARPLSPEQLCLSILQITDVLRNHVDAESAELEKQMPLAADSSTEQRSARAHQATRQAIDKLRPHMDTFASLYSSGVGQTSDEFFASPDQALFMANGGSVFQWSSVGSNNVTGQIVKQPDASIAASVLFRSLLSRDPTQNEGQWIGEILSQAGDKKPAVAQELVWSLLTTYEFRV